MPAIKENSFLERLYIHTRFDRISNLLIKGNLSLPN